MRDLRRIFGRWWLVCSNFLTVCAGRHMTQSSDQLLFERFALYRETGTRDACEGLLPCLNTTRSVPRRLGMGKTMAADDEMTGYALTKALVISASQENRAALSEALAANGFVPALCSSMAEARKFIESDDTEIVFCDDCVHDGCLKSVVAEVAKRHRPIRVIAVSRTGEWAEYFDALSMGAFDYLSLPPRRDELDRVLASALDKRPGDRTKVEAAI
jgi:ActR/RegA family two-component response regulator